MLFLQKNTNKTQFVQMCKPATSLDVAGGIAGRRWTLLGDVAGRRWTSLNPFFSENVIFLTFSHFLDGTQKSVIFVAFLARSKTKV